MSKRFSKAQRKVLKRSREESEARARQLLARVGLGEKESAYPAQLAKTDLPVGQCWEVGSAEATRALENLRPGIYDVSVSVPPPPLVLVPGPGLSPGEVLQAAAAVQVAEERATRRWADCSPASSYDAISA